MKRITAQQAATARGVSVQMVRRYCKDDKVHGALETAQGWMIPEGALRPGTQTTREFYQTPLVKKILYQHARNNHFGIYEYIHPFNDYNSRVGRILLMKEWLKNDVDPFILDDKRRGAYFRGISQWENDPEILRSVVQPAQERFQRKVEFFREMQRYHESWNTPILPIFKKTILPEENLHKSLIEKFKH